MISGIEFFLECLIAIIIFVSIYYFFKSMNTKNIGVMNWDSIIQLLIFHIKNGKKVNVNIYGDNLSFTFDSKN